MSIIRLETKIAAPREIVFDLARSVDTHLESTRQTGERAVAGKTSGLMELGDEVTWRAKHLGFTQELSTRITLYDRPAHFRDCMLRGAFARFDHDHFFEDDGAGTLMRDVFDFTAPLGPLGRFVDRLFLARYMRNFLRARNEVIRVRAEQR